MSRYIYYDFGNKEIEISVDNSEIEDAMLDALDDLTKEQIIELFMEFVPIDDMFDYVFDAIYEKNESVAREIADG